MYIPKGIIDIHAHILPGIDDGARDMEESVRMLDMAARQGVTGVIATPHYSRRQVLDGLSERVGQLQEAIRRHYPEFAIYPGQETFYHHELTDRLKAGEAHTLAGSRCVLVEFAPSAPYRELFLGIRKLAGAGYIPVLAHMERYACLREAGTRELRSCGCWLQMNYESIQGHWFRPETRWCRRQVETGAVQLLGTDMHRMDYRPPKLGEALAWLESHVDPEHLQQLVYHKPARIIADGIRRQAGDGSGNPQDRADPRDGGTGRQKEKE